MVRTEWLFSLFLPLPHFLFSPQAAVQRFSHVTLKAQHWKPLTVPREECRETKAKAGAKASCQEPPSPAAVKTKNSKTVLAISLFSVVSSPTWRWSPSPFLYPSLILLSSQFPEAKLRAQETRCSFLSRGTEEYFHRPRGILESSGFESIEEGREPFSGGSSIKSVCLEHWASSEQRSESGWT